MSGGAIRCRFIPDPAPGRREPERPEARTSQPARPRRAALQLALAHFVQRQIETGAIRNYANAARSLKVTRARITQVTKLLLLAPDIQERLLVGDLKASERALRAVVCEPAWDRQFQVANPA